MKQPTIGKKQVKERCCLSCVSMMSYDPIFGSMQGRLKTFFDLQTYLQCWVVEPSFYSCNLQPHGRKGKPLLYPIQHFSQYQYIKIAIANIVDHCFCFKTRTWGQVGRGHCNQFFGQVGPRACECYYYT